MHPFTKSISLMVLVVSLTLLADKTTAETGVAASVPTNPMAVAGLDVHDLLFMPFSEIIERELAAVATREADGAASPLGTSCCSGDEVCYAPFQACLSQCPPTFPENFSCIGACRQEYVACTIAVCGS